MRIADRLATRRQVVLGGAAATAGLVLKASGLAASPTAEAVHPADRWMARLPGNERLLLDAPDPHGDRVLTQIEQIFDTARNVYGLPDTAVGVAAVLYARTTWFAFDDVIWHRYDLGATLDPPVPDSPNPWRARPGAGIEALHRRGAVFLLCRVALVTRAGQLAAARGLNPDRVAAELADHVLPEVTVVPNVVVAMQRAQRRGIAYCRVG